ncbi:hypothetical protein KRR38_04890 [Novosphingobium sp. G106]|nr:hypothetical protein [Novosphingobium sp. G106]MBV1687028.1 hypothetical protein [Novosphingobium sp. G106]
MTVSMRKGLVLAGIAVIVLLVLAYAGIDGGREPLRPISEPVPVPELTK